MSAYRRFRIQWSAPEQRWFVVDDREGYAAADFATLLEAEAYCIERNTRSER